MKAKEQAKKQNACTKCQLRETAYCRECYNFDKFVPGYKTISDFQFMTNEKVEVKG